MKRYQIGRFCRCDLVSKRKLFFSFASVFCFFLSATTLEAMRKNTSSGNTQDKAEQTTTTTLAHNQNFSSSSSSSIESSTEKFVLSIDGGGIRGVIPAFILSQIEERLTSMIAQNIREKIQTSLKGSGEEFPKEAMTALSAHLPKMVHLAKAFDLMAGTSTGGIITLGLNTPDGNSPPLPRYKARDLLDLYKTKGELIFPPSPKMAPVRNFLNETVFTLIRPKFNSGPLETLFQDYFSDGFLQNTITNVIIPAYDLRRERLHVFDTQHALSPGEDYLLRDVARATSAAPTYFNPAKIKNRDGHEHLFADGGIIANNPTLTAFVKAKTLFPQAQITLISLGTGFAKRGDLSQFGDYGLLGWGPVIPSVIMDGTSAFTDENLVALSKPQQAALRYIRLQPQLAIQHTAMDAVSPDNVHNLLSSAEQIWKEKSIELMPVMQELANRYTHQTLVLYPQLLSRVKEQMEKGALELSHQDFEFLKVFEISSCIGRFPSIHFRKVTLKEGEADKTSTLKIKNAEIFLLSKALPSIKHLDISNKRLANRQTTNTGITERGVGFLRENLLSLKKLNVKRNVLLQNPSSSLSSSSWTSLTDLNISRMHPCTLHSIPRPDDPDIKLPCMDRCHDRFLQKFLTCVPNLQILKIHHNPLTSETGRFILEEFPFLQELSVAYTPALDGVLQPLSPQCHLVSLNLSHTAMNDSQLRILAKQLPTSLKALKLHYNKITAAGAPHLTRILQSPTLLTLDISQNDLKGEGIRLLGQALTQNDKLTSLNIKRVIPEEDWEDLVSFFDAVHQNTRLQKLYIGRWQSVSQTLLDAKERLEKAKLSLKIDES